MPTASELPIDTSASALQMAEAMFGSGISINSASYTGATSASGIYTDGDTVAPELTPSDSGVILSTGRAEDVTNSSGDVNVSSRTTTRHGEAGDSDLTALAGMRTYDAAVFEAEFVPEGSTLTMQFVFSSEEYLEYVNKGFNDVVGVWVNGEKAEMTIGTGDISIDNINDESNENLYVDNYHRDDTYNTEMDGFTITLTLTAPVNAGEVNTIKIGIADAGDDKYDSNLLIAGDSIQTALVAGDDELTVTEGESEVLDVLANDIHTPGSTLTVTHINGQPVGVGSTVTLANGEQVTLNADGTFTLWAQPDVEDPETTTFTYTVADDLGNTDTGVVEMTTVPCFVAGTLIDTLEGSVPVEALQTGMRVRTRDNGFQPLRWIGRSQRKARGADAPVVLQAGALGRHETVELSPCHRVFLASGRAEMLFGTPQVLVKAKDLVNGSSIRRRMDGAAVTYVHLLFDRHEIVCGNGLFSESYHPGAETADSFDTETRAEILRLIGGDWSAYGPSARPALKSYEAELLLQAG
ncbi:choice-of-anchor L domain-containing protein [Phaeobacter sp. PT47_59]|uniref:choice-of-anchor L domain-containing protein n=1 Tax=Phaeobacter sp. PT47_59 TaxID=3029979 RepID=UPI0023809435|nr:choice-of-anchor L domain-containing protein [Phaeobacter sp. PT47_59]MDE4172985.1 choice-of-anchor L domain-containing protein [Phaeobacter sp. PT47_59]